MKFVDRRLVSSRYSVCYGDVVTGTGVHSIDIETGATSFEGIEVYAEFATTDLPMAVAAFPRNEVAGFDSF